MSSYFQLTLICMVMLNLGIFNWVGQMMKIRDRIVHFEKLDLEMERSRNQLEEMKNLLFADQLNVFFHTRRARKAEDRVEKC